MRNAFEQPGTLQPLRRLTANPKIYLRTVFGSPERVIDTSTLDTVASAITSAVGIWSGGRQSRPDRIASAQRRLPLPR